MNECNSLPIKAAICEPVGGHGGMNYYDIGLCQGLGEAGVDTYLFTCDETQSTEDPRYRFFRPYKKIFGDNSAFLRGVRYIKGSLYTIWYTFCHKIKIIHFHWFHVGPLEFFNLIVAKMMLRKVVVTAHDVEAFSNSMSIPLLVPISYKLANLIIAHNNFSKKEIIEKLETNEERIKIIPHGNYLHVIEDIPEKQHARSKLHLGIDKKIILFFGQIKEVKGLDILLRALKDISSEEPNIELVIAGKLWKTDFKKYKDIIDNLQIEQFCKLFIRYIPDEEVCFFYAAADLVILPYRKIYQSGVLLMALSYQKPVVVSDLDGMLEIVKDRETGYVFRNNDANHLAKVVLSALNNSHEMAKIAENGKQLMVKEYSWQSIGVNTLELYRSLG